MAQFDSNHKHVIMLQESSGNYARDSITGNNLAVDLGIAIVEGYKTGEKARFFDGTIGKKITTDFKLSQEDKTIRFKFQGTQIPDSGKRYVLFDSGKYAGKYYNVSFEDTGKLRVEIFDGTSTFNLFSWYDNFFDNEWYDIQITLDNYISEWSAKIIIKVLTGTHSLKYIDTNNLYQYNYCENGVKGFTFSPFETENNVIIGKVSLSELYNCTNLKIQDVQISDIVRYDMLDYTDKQKLNIPEINPKSQIFSDDIISVECTSETEGAKIKYTLDGTIPIETSQEYTEKIQITRSTVLKAIATKDGYYDSEIVTEIYIKKREEKKIMENGRVGQSAGIMTLLVKPYGTNDTEYRSIGEVPQESAEQFKSTNAPAVFKNKKTGNNVVFARNNPGEQHYTVEVEHSTSSEEFLSDSIVVSGGKRYGGANAGKSCKQFALRLRPDYMGDDDSQDIIMMKAIVKVDVEINSGTETKTLMKLDFTACSEPIEVQKPDAPVLTASTTSGSLAAGAYTYIAVAATVDGRKKSDASNSITVPGTGTNSIEVAFEIPGGADTIKLYRSIGSSVTSRLCTNEEVKAGKIIDDGSLTWTTETAVPADTTTKPVFYATHII